MVCQPRKSTSIKRRGIGTRGGWMKKLDMQSSLVRKEGWVDEKLRHAIISSHEGGASCAKATTRQFGEGWVIRAKATTRQFGEEKNIGIEDYVGRQQGANEVKDSSDSSCIYIGEGEIV